MKIRQLSVNYIAEQDRILLRLNTSGGEEMRVWLTRRLMLGLWPMLQRMHTRTVIQAEAAGATLASADEDLKRMLTDFRKDQFLQEADFQTPYEAKPSVLPLGTEPLLVTDVDAGHGAQGKLRLTFHEKLPAADGEPRSFRMSLEPKLMQGLLHLLDQAIMRAQWREPFHAPAGAQAEPEGSPQGRPASRGGWIN